MDNEYTYRAARIDDCPQLRRLAVKAYGTYAPILSAENAAALIDNLSNEARWTYLVTVSKSFVCMQEQEIIGMVFLMPQGNAWDIFEAEWSYIRTLAVDPLHKGQGIATRLMNLCITHARNTGEHFVALHTSEIMVAARHIYEKMGFAVLKEIPARMGKRYWLYLLELDPKI